MSNSIHTAHFLKRGDVVHVEVNQPTRVRLLDENNYQKYRQGRTFHFHGGFYRGSPIKIHVPSTRRWHIVMDLGGRTGTLKYSIKIIKQ